MSSNNETPHLFEHIHLLPQNVKTNNFLKATVELSYSVFYIEE